MLYVSGAIFGIGLGGDYMIIPLVTAEIFGIEILGRLLGVILTAGGIADAAAPWLIGRLRDTTGSYSDSCFVLVGIGVARRTGCFGFTGAAESSMSAGAILRLGSLKDVGRFQSSLASPRPADPVRSPDRDRSESPLRWPLNRGPFKIGNRIAVQPMEGWDATPDGAPSENTVRRWQRFGRSGGKLIWGGEAVAVSHEGRANPNQLLAAPRTQKALAHLRAVLRREHILTTGSDDGLSHRFAIDALRPLLPPE